MNARLAKPIPPIWFILKGLHAAARGRDQSMIRKSVKRFSEKIAPNQRTKARR
jgi:hypothetical protein